MDTGDYLLFGFLVVLVIVGLIINPAIGIGIIFFLYLHSRVKKQKSETDRLAEYYKDIQLRKQDYFYDAVNKRVARKEETKKNRL